MRLLALLFVGGALASASGQEVASVARLRRQCVVSARLRPDVGAYQITWGTVRFERFTRLGTDEYYTQLCYPKAWMGKPAEPARRAAALYAGVWRLPKGKKMATLEQFVFQDQGKVEPARRLASPIGQVWYLPAPCICASKIHLDTYLLAQERQLRRIDADSWERALKLPEGTSRGEAPVVDLVAMEARLKLRKGDMPAGSLRVKLKLEGLKLIAERAEFLAEGGPGARPTGSTP